MDRVARADNAIRVRVGVPLSLSLAAYCLSSCLPSTSRAVPWHCFLCWSAECISCHLFHCHFWNEKESLAGLAYTSLIPLHEAPGSSHYHCPYAQTRHLSSAQEDTGREAASSSGPSPVCCLDGEEEEGGMVHTVSNQDWSRNPADGGKSGRGGETTGHLVSRKHQEPFPGFVMV